MPPPPSLLSLPLECFQVILQLLVDQSDKTTLARLLRVNRYVCSATLTYLYAKVFSATNSANNFQTTYGAIQTILRQLPEGQVSDLLSAAYDVFPERTSSPLADSIQPERLSQQRRIDYLSFVHTFNFELGCFTPPTVHFGGTLDWKAFYMPRLAKFALRSKRMRNTLEDGTKSEEGPEEFILAGNQYYDGVYDEYLRFPDPEVTARIKVTALRYSALAASLRRELTQTICFPILEQIQSVVLPLSDLERYLDVVDRFQSLSSVTFTMDEILLPDVLDIPGPDAPPERVTMYERLKRKQDNQFKSMTAFIQGHTRLFPGQLQSAGCTDLSGWPRVFRCPDPVIDGIQEGLPPLVNPRSIIDSNCRRAAHKIKSTDLSSVVRVELTHKSEAAAAVLYRNDPVFLSRCISLKTLGIQSFGAGSFRWAVKAKEEMDRRASNFHVPPQADAVSIVDAPPLPLAPLESVWMSTDTLFKDEVNDIVLAFGKTLVFIDFCSLLFDTPVNITTFSFGREWKLPQLKYFALSAPRLRLLADPGFYSNGLGPNLEKLQVLDRSWGSFEVRDLYTCQPIMETMPNLTYIWLEGWSGLTFHPDSFYRTPKLESLHIRMFLDEPQAYIPPEDELAESVFYILDPIREHSTLETVIHHTTLQGIDHDSVQGHPQDHLGQGRRRPLWTWDWYLPNLSTMHLDGTIAFLFQFRMLAGCPALRHLALNIGTPENMHRRVLSLQDFISPASFSSSSTNYDSFPESVSRTRASNGHQELMVAKSLHHLALYGGWTLDEALRAEIFPRTFPNVRIFMDYFTEGCSLRDWISTVRVWKKLEKASLMLMQNELLGSISILEDCGLVQQPPARRARRREDPTSAEPQPKPRFYFNGQVWVDKQE